MACSTLLRRLLLLSFVVGMSLAAAASGDSSDVAGTIRVNCGASASATDSDGREWPGDAVSNKTTTSTADAGVAASASYDDPSLPSAVPYKTARVFNSSYTYSFPVAAGRVFLRLFFYPSAYGARPATDALFGVTAAGVTLLRDFNASQTAIALNLACIVLEYSLHVSDSADRTLRVTFTPSQSQYYAFVNGIEIVPAPAGLFSKPVPTLANGRPDTAFQTMYRLNVGGAYIAPSNDSGRLFRSWDDDSTYILGAAFGVSYGKDSNVTIQYGTVPSYAAPEDVYGTARSMGPTAQVNLNYNLTWVLPVDAGFFYLVRLHFCEIQYPITRINQRVFDVYVGNRTAQEMVDVIALSGGIGRPVYADYVVVAEPGSGQTDLWVELHPDVASKPQYYDAILNGLEVFKIQTYGGNNSLAGPNPPIVPQRQEQSDAGNDVRPRKKNGYAVAWAVTAGGLAAVLLGCLGAWAVYKRHKKAASSVVVDAPQAVASEAPDSPSSVVLDQAKSPYVFDAAR